MENPIDNKSPGIKYTANNKEFLAAFYSQAVHNVFIVFYHISKRLGLPEPEEDGKVIDWINKQLVRIEEGKGISAISKQRFLEMIDQHFPFLRIIGAGKKGTDAENDLLRNAKLLVSLLKQLRDFRNTNAHAKYFPKNETDLTQLISQLYAVYDANINLVKRDFFESNVRIDIKQADLYESNFNHLRRFTTNKDKSLLNENGKVKKSIPNPQFKYHFEDSVIHRLSTYGHVFFSSFFLEKKYSILMQKWVSGLKDARETSKRMTSEVFSRTCIQLPRVRLHSEKTADALVLDMLNELTKAPAEFYDQLHESVKQKFTIDSSDREDEDEDILSPEVKTVRKQNRFAYFALRYFDEVNAFEKMRFQIDLGNYHFHLYRAVINEQEESRHLVKRLFGFGKLNDYDQNLAPEYWKEKNKDLDYYEGATEPFVTKTFPHYHLEENKIGIRFLENPNEPKWPGLDTDTKSAYPKYPLKQEKKDRTYIAEAFLSVNELLPMAFCHYLYTQIGENNFVEKLISEKYRALRKMLADLKSRKLIDAVTDQSEAGIKILLFDNYRLNANEVPERLLQYLLKKKKIHNPLADENKIQGLIDETEKRLNWFEDTQKQTAKIGKARYHTLRAGDSADWLVRDFMRFQPIGYAKDKDGNRGPDLKSKANPKKYQLLQKSLALYSLEKEKLPGLFRACNLIGSDNKHPFLDQIIKKMPSDWKSFYTDYLKERKTFLKKCLEAGKQKKSFQDYYHFLKIKERKNESGNLYDGWDRQLHLPTGIFTTAIEDWFRNTTNTTIQEWYSSLSRSQQPEALISNYLRLALQDGAQPFYHELPMVYDYYRNTHPKGLTFAQRTEIQKSNWEPAIRDGKIFREKQKSLHEKTVQKFEAIEKDIHLLESTDALRNRLDHAFGREKIKNVLAQNNLTNSRMSADLLFKKVKTALVKDYTDQLHAIQDYRNMLDTEKRLRHIKAEDAVTSLMIRHLMQVCQISIGDTGTPIRLNQINPMGETEKTGILDGIHNLQEKLNYYRTDIKGILLTDDENKLGSWIIYSDDTKAKKQGNFRKLLKDRRLNNLARYISPAKTADEPVRIHRSRIERELDIYDRNRIRVIKKMHELESAVFSVFPFDTNVKEFENFRDYLESFAQAKELDAAIQDQFLQLASIRNAILHNQYPSPEFVKGIQLFDPEGNSVPEKEGLGIASQLEQLVTAGMEQINRIV